jgi:altronate hydrolase
MSEHLLQIHPRDNVAVVLEPQGDIPVGHKVALVDIPAGADIIKYGNPIGHATQEILAGAWVHSHNLATNLGVMVEYTYAPVIPHIQSATCTQTFSGYPRPDGRVGVRNEIWVLPTVGCVNRTAETLARQAHARWAGHGIDGVYAFPHPYGCSQLGEDHAATQRILAALARHPNAGGVLIVGLGCENNHIAAFKDVLGEYDPLRIAFLNCQDAADEFAKGEALLAQLAHQAATERQPVPVSKLVVGLKCGGSDAFSGITANPLVGVFSDRLTACGGSTVLTEVPEMFGAEHLLMARAADRDIFARTVAMVNDFKAYFTRHGQVIYENPSPGNKAGGITTLEEKSLGCTQKAGSAPVVDVLAYGEAVCRSGVSLLNGPGNDIVAVTALAAAGCHLILFTTGRGTPLGAPVPTVKIATNFALAVKKPGWIDVNAGLLLDGTPLDDAADALFTTVLAVASGQTTRNEDHDFREIAIWKDGVTL